MALEELVKTVSREQVAAHLIGRAPDLLDVDVDSELLESLITSAAIPVARFLPDTPEAERPEGLWSLAADAVALETGSRIEYALFPEQQGLGDTGRGYYLHRLYLERLDEIRAHPDAVRPGTNHRAIVADMTGYGVPEPHQEIPC